MQTIKVGIKFGLEQPVAGVGVEHRSEPLHLGSLVIRSVQISFPGAQFSMFLVCNFVGNFKYIDQFSIQGNIPGCKLL